MKNGMEFIICVKQYFAGSGTCDGCIFCFSCFSDRADILGGVILIFIGLEIFLKGVF